MTVMWLSVWWSFFLATEWFITRISTIPYLHMPSPVSFWQSLYIILVDSVCWCMCCWHLTFTSCPSSNLLSSLIYRFSGRFAAAHSVSAVLSVSPDDSRLRFSSRRVAVTVGSLLDDQHWHTVLIERFNKQVNLTVDSHTHRFQTKGEGHSLEVDYEVRTSQWSYITSGWLHKSCLKMCM